MESFEITKSCNETLFEKFMELSEYFTQTLGRENIEPEQKCEIIKTMLMIYRELTT